MSDQIKTMEFDTECGKILNIVINSLYGNKEIFLRELISNSSDACEKKRTAEVLSADDSATQFKITIQPNLKDRTLIITDNGIGMSEQEMIENLGTIARSGTQRFLENMNDEKKNNSELIGNFGVGFYSAFMVSQKIEVISRKNNEGDFYIWQSEGKSNFTISKYQDEANNDFSTKIILHIKNDEDEFLDKFRISHIVKTYSNYVSFPIMMIDEEGKEEEQLNSVTALWKKNKNDVTEEEYNEFYKSASYNYDDPWLIIHNHAEGTIEYKNLLFIPSMKPFDLFHPEKKNRVKLYVKRVFITDSSIELLPSFLRFVSGVIDIDDLPLNISRETLQNNPVITRVKNNIVKKILSEIKKIRDKDLEKFNVFWSNFGAVIKEGLCDVSQDKDSLLELSTFKTTKSEQQEITLQQYVDNMKEGQKEIYYFIGEDLESMKSSPQIEGFLKKDVEVLLLTDHVDSFWVNTVNQYNDIDLKSITKTNSKLDDIKSDSEEANQEEETEAENVDENNLLIDFIKKTLEGQISDVIISSTLTKSPACISASEQGMDFKMEQFLLEQNQIQTATNKILNINLKHSIIKSIIKNIKSNNNELAKSLIYVVFDLACFIEGDKVKNVNKLYQRVNQLISDKV